jgi:peptidoglycan hydrolase FlgJ
MNSISSITGASQTASSKSPESTASRLLAQSMDRGGKGDLKSTFQDVVAGTFYKEMMKSLHKMHGKPAYVYGGSTEQIFQSQMDQQVAEQLAHSHGGQMSDSLYQAFLHSGRA